MTKVSRKNLGALEKAIIKDFWVAMNSLTDAERIIFFSRVFTPTEIKMFAKRVSILKELKKRKPYQQIRETYGVMPNTIGRMSNIIHRSGEAFSTILEKLISKPTKPRKKSHGSRTMAGTKKIFGL